MPVAQGGTGQTTAANAFNALSPLTTVGDILYEETGSVGARLPIGTTGQVLTVSGGKPSWTTAASGGVTSITAGSGLTGGTITTSGTIALDVYTGTSFNNTSFPVGTTVSAQGASAFQMNESSTLWVATAGCGAGIGAVFAQGSNPSSGYFGSLAGTWNSRGYITDGVTPRFSTNSVSTLFQRSA